MLATNHNLSSVPRSQVGKDKVGSCELFSDLHPKALESESPPPKKEEKKKGKFLNDNVFFKKEVPSLFLHTQSITY